MRRRFDIRAVLAMAGLLSATAVATATAGARAPIPVPSAPAEMTYRSLRGVIYCEIWLFTGTPATGLSADYYNTSALNNSASASNTCPANMWATVNPAQLKSQYDILLAYKNGPRGWTMDTITLPVGPVETFGDVKARWMG